MRTAALLGVVTVVLGASIVAAAAPPAPSGAHPRLFLDAATLATMQSQQSDPATGTAQAFALCADARTNPGNYATGGTWSFDWGFVATACALAYQVGADPQDAATALTYFNALLDDYQQIGDAAGGDDVVQHDTGYSVRTYAAYAGLAYDWLHDAPGMTAALRTHALGRFAAWTDWYAASGYLTDVPGANYNAGWVFAASLIAVAQAGDAGAAGDALWQAVVDELFGQVLARGLSELPPDPANDVTPGGVLIGGDWAEGWQYGPLSVIEYVLAARALEEQGVALPAIDAWAGDLCVRSLYATNPGRTGLWVGGDFDSDQVWTEISPRTLLATLVGAASAEAQQWARAEHARVGTKDTPLFEALGDARTGTATPFPASSPTTYWAGGTHTLYTRDRWEAAAIWATFRAGPRMVPDHEHSDSGNWALSRGADDVVVDPSPYGSRSTLTSNAPAVDSNLIGPEYHPSQTPWNAYTTTAWRRVVPGNVVVARADYHDAYRFRETDSDVPVALRDWILVPVGGDATVVVLDRVVTGDPARGLHVRVRTPATLSLTADTATGSVGGSTVAIRYLWSSSGAPVIGTPAIGDCSTGSFGACTDARFAVRELSLDVAGPDAGAIAVIDAYASGGSAPSADLLSGSGYRGVSFARGGKRWLVIGSDAPDGSPGASLSYDAPAELSEHVVVDAPTDAGGMSDVTATPDGSICHITIVPHASGTPLDGHPLVFDLTSSCEVSDPGSLPIGPDAGAGGAGGAGAGGSAAAGAASDEGDSGCSCRTTGAAAMTAGALPGLVLGLTWLGRRRCSSRRVRRRAS